jgi:hypothetical protein
MTLLQAALCIGVIMSLDLAGWRPPKWLLAIVLVWSLLFYPQARGVILGQFAIFGFFSLAATLYSLKHRRGFLAGALLVLSTVKPTLIFLVVPFLMLWAIIGRRWRFLAGFLSVLAILVLGSLIALPTWVSEWFYRISAYSDYTVGQSPVWLFTQMYAPALGSGGETALVAVLLMGTAGTWWITLRSGRRSEFCWALGITLVVSSLIVPRSATTNYVMLLFPILWSFAVLDRKGRWGRIGLLISMLISCIGLWWLHYATVVGNQEQPIMFIPVPVTLGLVLLFGRGKFVQDPPMKDVNLHASQNQGTFRGQEA